MLGTGVGGTSLAVQRTDFPFTRGFWVPRTFSARAGRAFSTTVGPLWETTRLQLVTRTTNVASSPVVTIGVRVRVGVRRQAAGRRAVVLSGVVRPAVPRARVSVQRRRAPASGCRSHGPGVSALPATAPATAFVCRAHGARAEVRVVALPERRRCPRGRVSRRSGARRAASR